MGSEKTSGGRSAARRQSEWIEAAVALGLSRDKAQILLSNAAEVLGKARPKLSARDTVHERGWRLGDRVLSASWDHAAVITRVDAGGVELRAEERLGRTRTVRMFPADIELAPQGDAAPHGKV